MVKVKGIVLTASALLILLPANSQNYADVMRAEGILSKVPAEAVDTFVVALDSVLLAPDSLSAMPDSLSATLDALLAKPDSFIIDSVHYRTDLKLNFLYLLTATPNFTIDFGFSKHWSLSFMFGYNPYSFPKRHRIDNKIVRPKFKHYAVMPEWKYWFRKHHRGHYLGLHGIYSRYNVGGLSFIPALNNNRYDGYLYGAGLSWGWHSRINKRTGVEFSIGGGYLRLHHHKYEACQCSGMLETRDLNYFGPTKLDFSLTYRIK